MTNMWKLSGTADYSPSQEIEADFFIANDYGRQPK